MIDDNAVLDVNCPFGQRNVSIPVAGSSNMYSTGGGRGRLW